MATAWDRMSDAERNAIAVTPEEYNSMDPLKRQALLDATRAGLIQRASDSKPPITRADLERLSNEIADLTNALNDEALDATRSINLDWNESNQHENTLSSALEQDLSGCLSEEALLSFKRDQYLQLCMARVEQLTGEKVTVPRWWRSWNPLHC